MLHVHPDGDTSFVRVRHAKLPDCEWLLRLPEYGYGRHPLRGVTWDIAEEGRRLAFSCAPRVEGAGVAYSGTIVALDDEVRFQVVRRNVSDKEWDKGEASLFCLMSRDAPIFHDIDGVRTYALSQGVFLSVNQLVNGVFADHRMAGFHVRGQAPRGGEVAVERLMAKISRDGEWILGIATDIAWTLSCNQQPQVSCIHSNPKWGPWYQEPRPQPRARSTCSRAISRN